MDASKHFGRSRIHHVAILYNWKYVVYFDRIRVDVQMRNEAIEAEFDCCCL